MAVNDRKFLISVCNVYARDPETLAGLWAGYSDISSSFNLAMTATDVRGGENNTLLMRYMHDRVLTVEVVGATFSREILAMNAGSKYLAGTNVKSLTEECCDFKAGKGTMKGTAVGTVMVAFEDGSCETVTPTIQAITLVLNATYTGKATLVYDTMTPKADLLTISTVNPPSVVDLTLIGKIKDKNGVLQEYMNIHIPSFSVDGNYNLAFTADGVSQETLSGTALGTTGQTCAEGDGYAYVTFIPATVAP